MNPFDRQIAEYVVTWEPYGWPPADQTLVEFGMSSGRLRERCVQIIVDVHRDRDREPYEAELISTLARSLMWHRGAHSYGGERAFVPSGQVYIDAV